jgi:diadenylate cyclase
LRGTVKELAQLDGAFVVSNDGFVVSACRYLDAAASDVTLPLGLGSRHLAGGSISSVTEAVPELWLLNRHNVQLRRPYKEERQGDLAVLVKHRELPYDKEIATKRHQ